MSLYSSCHYCQGIIRPVVNATALTWFIIYTCVFSIDIYVCNYKTKILLPQILMIFGDFVCSV